MQTGRTLRSALGRDSERPHFSKNQSKWTQEDAWGSYDDGLSLWFRGWGATWPALRRGASSVDLRRPAWCREISVACATIPSRGFSGPASRALGSMCGSWCVSDRISSPPAWHNPHRVRSWPQSRNSMTWSPVASTPPVSSARRRHDNRRARGLARPPELAAGTKWFQYRRRPDPPNRLSCLYPL